MLIFHRHVFKLASKSSIASLLVFMFRFQCDINRNVIAHKEPAVLKLSLFACEDCKVSTCNQLFTKSKAQVEVKVYPGTAYFISVLLFFFPSSSCFATCCKVNVGWETCIIQWHIIRLHFAEALCCFLWFLSTVAPTKKNM